LLDIQKAGDGIIFQIKVQPGAATNEIVGVKGDALKIKMVGFIARKLGVKTSGVEIISGHTTREKIRGLTTLQS